MSNDVEPTTKSRKASDYSCRIASVKNCPSLRTNLLSPTNIVLDYVVAVHVDLITRRDKDIWHFSVKGVPKFLVDAFKFLEDSNAFHIDGIFRKEGNASRLKNAWTIYCGLTPIPPECTAHDVCSLIKRFFREIKTPIFDDGQTNILKFAETLNNNEETVYKAISAVIERLPAVNTATLIFLLKQLKKISDYSNENRMSVDNLATVFAPSLFRDETPVSRPTKKKKDEQFHLMNFVRSRNNLQISVVKLLISKSHRLCNLCPSREVKLSRHSSEHYSSSLCKSTSNASNSTPKTSSRAAKMRRNDENVPPAVGEAHVADVGDKRKDAVTSAIVTTTPGTPDFIDYDDDTPVAKPSVRRSQSAKSSIRRVLSLRERPRNVLNFTSAKLVVDDPSREVKLSRQASKYYTSNHCKSKFTTSTNTALKPSTRAAKAHRHDESVPPAKAGIATETAAIVGEQLGRNMTSTNAAAKPSSSSIQQKILFFEKISTIPYN